MASHVAGVDGCPGGWIAAVHPLDDPGAARLALFADFADVLGHEPRLETIAVDIPIGLPESGTVGGRPADREARAVLGQRQSAVFAVPARAAVMCEDYRAACATALATSDPPRKVSKQAFNIFAKIREVDALMTADLQQRVYECHPEVAFWALNGERPLDFAKKVKSRPHPPGLALRRRLLREAGYLNGVLEAETFARSRVGPDDVLDACAAAWSAGRIARGAARRFPVDPEVDERGLRMEIWG